jgi:hypothetical protein
MARANPNTLATGWLRQSNAMTDAEHAADDAEYAALKAFYANETEAERKARQRKTDTAMLAPFGNRTFSIFADTSRDPR